MEEDNYCVGLSLHGEPIVVPTNEHTARMKKLSFIFNEFDKLLSDKDMIERIGQHPYDKFIGWHSAGMVWDSENKIKTIYGYRLEAVKYYCDTFNKEY